MVDLLSPVVVEWVTTAVKFAPVIGVLIAGVWDLRKQLLACIAHTTALSDRLLEERLARDDE